MVELAQHILGRTAHAVIQRRHHVQAQKHCTINTETDDLPWIAKTRSEHDQHSRAGCRQCGPDQMANAVESFAVIHYPTSPSHRSVPACRAANRLGAVFREKASLRICVLDSSTITSSGPEILNAGQEYQPCTVEIILYPAQAVDRLDTA